MQLPIYPSHIEVPATDEAGRQEAFLFTNLFKQPNAMTTHEALWVLMAPNWWTPLVAGIACAVHAVTDGECDAFHFDRAPSPRQAKWPDIHGYFVIRRSAVWIMVALFAGVPTALACILMFPWFHDGNYYATRQLIDGNVYAKGWASEPSGTSTARWSFDYRTRCYFAAAGIIILATVIFGTMNNVSLQR